MIESRSAHFVVNRAQSTMERLRMSRLTVLCSLLLLSISTAALAQSPCPTQEILGSAAKRSSDLVCVVPQVYGPGGLVGVDNGGPLSCYEVSRGSLPGVEHQQLRSHQCRDRRATQPSAARRPRVRVHLCQWSDAGSDELRTRPGRSRGNSRQAKDFRWRQLRIFRLR